MDKLIQGQFSGERALYNIHHKHIIDSTFFDGESPLKECSDLVVDNSIFKWKYPMWYSKNIVCNSSTLLETARSGIWYTDNITMNHVTIEAPKTFRRSSNITLTDCCMLNAEETMWNCKNIILNNVSVKGNYFGLNCENVKIDNFDIIGDYLLDGAKNIEISNAKLISKDSFWNCENVVIKDSIIVGEYLGWNSKNVTLINCSIESHQGMCYMDGIKLVNCKLLNTDLCFEYCYNVDADVKSRIDSVKNPYSGTISAKSIGEIILDEKLIDKSKVKIEVEDNEI